jgi:hypothetical protein
LIFDQKVVEKLKEIAGPGEDEPIRDASKTMFSLLRKRMRTMKRQRGVDGQEIGSSSESEEEEEEVLIEEITEEDEDEDTTQGW